MTTYRFVGRNKFQQDFQINDKITVVWCKKLYMIKTKTQELYLMAIWNNVAISRERLQSRYNPHSIWIQQTVEPTNAIPNLERFSYETD